MSFEPTDTVLKQLLDSYVAQSNEGGPQQITETAAHYGIAHQPLEVRGHDAFDARVRRSYELYAAPGQYTFEVGEEPVRQAGGAVSFTWVMRDCADADHPFVA
jgi:hypothetical protein